LTEARNAAAGGVPLFVPGPLTVPLSSDLLPPATKYRGAATAVVRSATAVGSPGPTLVPVIGRHRGPGIPDHVVCCLCAQSLHKAVLLLEAHGPQV
jgi:hypothetical protein